MYHVLILSKRYDLIKSQYTWNEAPDAGTRTMRSSGGLSCLHSIIPHFTRPFSATIYSPQTIMRSRFKVKNIEAFFCQMFSRTKQEPPDPQPTGQPSLLSCQKIPLMRDQGHRESDIIRSDTPSIVIANELLEGPS